MWWPEAFTGTRRRGDLDENEDVTLYPASLTHLPVVHRKGIKWKKMIHQVYPHGWSRTGT